MLRFDASNRNAAIVFAAAFALMVGARFLAGGAITADFALIAGSPAVLAVVVSLLRWEDDGAEEGGKPFAVFCAAAAATGTALYGPYSMIAVLSAYCVLLVTYLMMWSGRLQEQDALVEGQPLAESLSPRRTGRRARLQIVAMVAGVTLFSFCYRWLNEVRLEQTSALFIGLPAILAIAVAMISPPRTAIGTALKATTLALLVSGILLGEGFICIVMAAPIFLAVAALAGALIDHLRERKRRSANVLLLLIFLPMSFEGVRPEFSFPRQELVVVERTVHVGADQVERNLARTPDFSPPRPFFLQMGFPLPVETAGAGLEPGSMRSIRFAGGEGHPGELTLAVVATEPGRVVFRAQNDDSHIAHRMAWQRIEVEWSELAPGQTRVRWSMNYRRDLDPAWYFGPWERYAVALAGEYLIDSVAGAKP